MQTADEVKLNRVFKIWTYINEEISMIFLKIGHYFSHREVGKHGGESGCNGDSTVKKVNIYAIKMQGVRLQL